MKKIKNNVLLIFIILILLVISIAIISIVIFYNSFQNSKKIAPGVFIKSVNVSGMTKEEAHLAVSNYLTKNMSNHLTFSYSNYEYDVETEQIEAKFDVDQAVDYAYNIGRKGIHK